MNNDKTCRFCLEDFIPLVSLHKCYKDVNETISLSKIVKKLAQIEVEHNDGLPNQICENCLEELKRTYKFITMIQDSDKSLRSVEMLHMSPPKTEYFTDVLDEHDEKEVKIESSVKLEQDLVVSESDDDHVTIGTESEDMNQEQDYSKRLIKKEYICKTCDKEFKTKEELSTHINISHDFKYKCSFCTKTFPGQKHLTMHMRAHRPDEQRPHKCLQCGKKYSYEYQLKQHLFKHKEEKPFPCTKCEKGCLTAVSLKRHMVTHDENYKKPKHTCKVCGKTFGYPSFLAEHMKNHTGERPFLCSLCGKGFRQKGALLYHVRSHLDVRPYICEICKSSFVSAGILKVHMRRHTDERPYVCDICDRGFRQSSDCRIHRRIHFGIKLVECSVCKKKMSTTGQLTIHMRMHTGERPFPCQECYKRFSTKSKLVKHLRTHTGEKPYICNVCGKGFAQSSSLGIHLKIHIREENGTVTKRKTNVKLTNTHEDESSKEQCTCDECGKTFTQVSSLQMHLKTHSNSEINDDENINNVIENVNT